jgi:hypothetical protein
VTVLRVLQFIAVVLTAMALVPAGAHLFELPHKIALTEHDYFVVQSIYRGWALFGIVIIAAIAANLALTLMLWRRRGPFWPSLAAGLILAATLLVFFVWRHPANQATSNWTMVTADRERLRAQWEWSQAANAVLNFIALCCASASAVALRD